MEDEASFRSKRNITGGKALKDLVLVGRTQPQACKAVDIELSGAPVSPKTPDDGLDSLGKGHASFVLAEEHFLSSYLGAHNIHE